MTEQQAEDLRGATQGTDLKVVFAPADRAALAERIERRFDEMMRQGLVEEVRRLHERGDLHAELPAMRLIGYRQIWQHLASGTPLAEAARKAVIATRQLARRQLTWLRAEPGAEWFDSLDPKSPERIAARVAEWLRMAG